MTTMSATSIRNGLVAASQILVGVELVGCRRTFDKVHALRCFSISIAPASSWPCSGPPAAARPRRCGAVAGLEQLDEGRVLVGGDDITHVPPHRRNLGMVFQAYSLFPKSTRWKMSRSASRSAECPPHGGGSGPVSCSTWWAWPAWLVGTLTSSPAVSNSESPWLGRCASNLTFAIGRTAVSRCQSARSAERRDTTHPARGRDNDAVCHPRRGRSVVDGGQGGRDAGRPARAARLTGGGVLHADHKLRR